MRLLDTWTLRLEDFAEANLRSVRYVILSHTWENEEITFEDIQGDQILAQRKAGFAKVRNSCSQARKDGFRYIWIDTCCIDKRSSAELSEAINSMYTWYQRSQICYAYLSDVHLDQTPFVLQKGRDGQPPYRWFGRGWTLQELIAPKRVFFYSSDWTYLGNKEELIDSIAQVTGIDHYALKGRNLQWLSIARRMSWAANRQTTRTEDIAYCLLGIFNIHMPLLYGEGDKAFIRLQEEIIKTCNDQSIFAHRSYASHNSFFARSPKMFDCAGDVVQFHKETLGGAAMLNTSRGVRLNLLMTKDPTLGCWLAILNCQIGSIPGVFPCIQLRQVGDSENFVLSVDGRKLRRFARVDNLQQIDVTGFDTREHQPELVDIHLGAVFKDWQPRSVCVEGVPGSHGLDPAFWLICRDVSNSDKLKVNAVHPSDLWDKETWTLQPFLPYHFRLHRLPIGALQVEFRGIQCVIILGCSKSEGNVLPWCKLLPDIPSTSTSKNGLLANILESEDTQDQKSESVCESLGLVCWVKPEIVVGRAMFLVRLRSIASDCQGNSLRVA